MSNKNDLIPFSDTDIDSIANNPFRKEIDFSKILRIKFQARDIISCKLYGKITSNHNFNRANLVQSHLSEITCEKGNFKLVDIKDCFIGNSIFHNTNFDSGAWLENNIIECKFTNCRITNKSITNTQFKRVSFLKVDFTNINIKGCEFIECIFEACVTSNKLFESCILQDCEIIDTVIHIETITENFGLTATQVKGGKIIISKNRNSAKTLTKEDLAQMLESPDFFDDIPRFRLAFFLNGLETFYSDFFENALQILKWAEGMAIASSFTNLLQSFSRYLLLLFDKNILSVHPLLVMHHNTGMLSRHMGSNSNPHFNTVMGVHMTLSRIVEQYLSALIHLLENIQNPVRFLVVGPIDIKYYEKELAFLFTGKSVRITKVIKHNSPNELFVAWSELSGVASLIAIALSTKCNFEIEKIKKKQNVHSNTKSSKNKNLIKTNSLVNLSPISYFKFLMGFEKQDKNEFQIQLLSILPGDLFLKLGLKIHSKLLGKISSIIKEIL